MHTTNAFDQLQTASMIGGYNAQVKSSPPAATLYLTAGMGPYTNFYYAIEVSTSVVRYLTAGMGPYTNFYYAIEVSTSVVQVSYCRDGAIHQLLLRY